MILEVALLILVFIIVVYFIAQFMNNNTILDVFWGIGFVLIGLYTLFDARFLEPRPVLITTLALVWGLRLSHHIFTRNRGKKEDFRYAAWRKEMKANYYLQTFFKIFLVQGIVMFFVSMPIWITNMSVNYQLTALDLLGVVVFLAGFVIETKADQQLKSFKRTKNNQIIKTGLWKYSRHPNYFGESLVWLGFFIIASNVAWGWVSIISPILLTFILIKFSIPILEQKYDKVSEYQKYKKSTPSFFPKF